MTEDEIQEDAKSLDSSDLCHICLSNGTEIIGYVVERAEGLTVYEPMKVVDVHGYGDNPGGTFLERYAIYSPLEQNYVQLSGFHIVSYVSLSEEVQEFYNLNFTLDDHTQRLMGYRKANQMLIQEILRRNLEDGRSMQNATFH